MKILRPLPLLLALALMPLSTQATTAPDNPYQDGISGVELRALIQDAMSAARISGQISISGNRAYPPCSQPPSIQPQKGKWAMLKVTCSGKRSWTRHIRTSIKPGNVVPRKARVKEDSGPLVAVLNKSIKKGTVITAADIQMRPVSATSAQGSFTNPAHVIGQRLSKNLSEGRAIQARHLQKNYMIGRDMPVAIQFSGSGLSISTPGISLEDGELGDYIEVRNLSSGTVLKGMITGPQKITVRAKTH